MAYKVSAILTPLAWLVVILAAVAAISNTRFALIHPNGGLFWLRGLVIAISLYTTIIYTYLGLGLLQIGELGAVLVRSAFIAIFILFIAVSSLEWKPRRGGDG